MVARRDDRVFSVLVFAHLYCDPVIGFGILFAQRLWRSLHPALAWRFVESFDSGIRAESETLVLA